MGTSKLDCFVSAVVPLADDADIVEAFVLDLCGVLESNYSHYEVILVDDGSTDATTAKVDALLKRIEGLRLLRLSRRFGEEIAISAGLEGAIGDFTVVILPECDPPALIPEMIRRARDGAGCVFGVRDDTANDALWHRAGMRLFSRWAERSLGFTMPPGVTHFRVLSRQALNAITQIRDRSRYLRTLSSYVGYSNQAFSYRPVPRRTPVRRKTFLETVNLAINIVVANSLHPLRMVSLLSIALAFWNVAYLFWIAIVFAFKRHVAEGWTTSSVQHSIMFSGIFVVLAVLCEYTGRALGESRQRPLYYLLEERQSNVLVPDREKKNVVTESEDPPR